jgi:hypothetical protein
VNCIQAQMLLAAYREVKNGKVDTAELDEHLEQCSSCREVLARYSLVGEHIRTLPPVEPTPDMHAQLMRALASEHAQFIQHSASAPPPPAFLKPYLREYASSSQKVDAFTAFSSADTGPLPIIRTARKKKHSHFRQFAVAGLVAVFCMALLMGGITSLLLLAHGNVPGGEGAITINHPADVASTTYTTSTPYQHVVSAVADATSIYYTAYNDDTNAEWMLVQLDRTTTLSIPLLSKPSSGPLIVLGSKNGWLVWLQFEVIKTTKHSNLSRYPLHSPLYNWSLHALSLVSQWEPRDTEVPNATLTLASGTFDQEAVPAWVHSPVQGIWFTQNALLVAMLDKNGISHLMSYPFGTQSSVTTTTIATASSQHIFTSPTSNGDGTAMYWADEWRGEDGNLHSNIWTQEVLPVPPERGPRHIETTTITYPFLQNGLSFRPIVVDNMLFWLSSTARTSTTTNTTSTATPNSTPVPTATPNTNGNSIPTMAWNDTSLDNNVRGSLLMLPLDESLPTSAVPINTNGFAYALQAGTNFVLWQTDNGYGIYDVASRGYITVASDADNARFLVVNGDTAVWLPSSPTDVTPTADVGTQATLMAFNWPRK